LRHQRIKSLKLLSKDICVCFPLGVALESLYISLQISMYNPWPVPVVTDHPECHVLAEGAGKNIAILQAMKK